MGALKQFLEIYEELLKEDTYPNGNESFDSEKESFNVVEGSVFESPLTELPFLFTVVEKKKNSVVIALMSDFWELATNRDIFVQLPHPVRETWIVETDITCEVPENLINNFLFVSKLEDEDIKLIKEAVSGKDIPVDRRGRGYNDPVHKRFKELERERLQSLFTGFIRKDEKEDCIVINFAPQFVDTFEPAMENLLVASSTERSFETENFQAIFNPEKRKISLLFKEQIYGKPGKVNLQLGSVKIGIYRGVIKDFEIVNADEDLFNLLRNIEVEVKDDSKTFKEERD